MNYAFAYEQGRIFEIVWSYSSVSESIFCCEKYEVIVLYRQSRPFYNTDKFQF